MPQEREPYVQERIPYWSSPVIDPATGRNITSHIMNQDFVGWVGQGAIADRTKEHLGTSDRGVVMMRRRFLSDLDRIAQGEEPKAVIRDAAINQCIELPIIDRESFIHGLSRADMAHREQQRRGASAAYQDGFLFLAGQPEAVRKAFEEAMR